MGLEFAYTGRQHDATVSGSIEAPSVDVVVDLLRSRGITPLSIEPRGEAASSAPSTDLLAALKARMEPAVQLTDLLLFTRQIHTLLRSGVPILRALAGLQESSTAVRLKDALGEVRRSLESGIELSMGLAQQPKVFDAFFVSMVRVGEMTGRLDEVFLRLFKHLEFELFMGQQVKSALRYPVFVLAAMAAAIGVINVMVVPAFAGVFKSFNAELPLATRLLMGASEFTLQWGWALVAAGVAAFFGHRHWVNTPSGREAWDRIRLRVPLAGKIVHKATLSRFARSLSLALKSGVPIEQALSVVSQTVDNHHIARKVDGMRHSVERGESILRAALGAGVFTPVVLQMIAVGEETGAVDEMMEEVADLYSNDVQYELKTLSQQIEPILIVFIGVLVLVLALGVFLPVWDLGRVAFKR
jgi:MSHA biogenesis protein MshG